MPPIEAEKVWGVSFHWIPCFHTRGVLVWWCGGMNAMNALRLVSPGREYLGRGQGWRIGNSMHSKASTYVSAVEYVPRISRES